MSTVRLAPLAAALLLTAVAASAEPCYEDLSASETVERIQADVGEEPLILDVRTPEEFHGRGGHIDGAVLLPVQELSLRVGELAHLKDREIILVCRSGSRSAWAASYLCGQGFTRVKNLSGGMGGWLRAGQPVKSSR